MKKSLSQDVVAQVLERREAGTPASKIPGELGIPSSTVNVILSAHGITKAREDVRNRDAARLAKWLENGSAATTPEPEPTDFYSGVSVKELRSACKASNLKGYSRMNRDQLVELLADAAAA